jgi:hypothetical protein
MGLDTVELVMAVEKEFRIDMPTDVLSEIVSLGDLHASVVRILGERSDRAVDSADVWKRLQEIMVREFSIPVTQLVPGAEIVRDLGLS